MGRFRGFLCVCVFVCLGTSLVMAQGGSTGAIQGTVSDLTGARVPGVTITVRNQGTTFERIVLSGDTGNYSVPALEPGRYLVLGELSGFAKVEAKDVVVNVGRTTDLNMTLQPAGIVETVSISGAAPLVETTKTDVGGVVENREVTNLPLNGRNFSSLAALIPGARPVGAWDPTKTRIGAISIAGAGGRNINTTIDGIDNKDNTVGGYVQNVTIEGIQEFALKTQRFSAADGRSQGGLLSIVTKSGTNDVHGSWFSFFRDKKLNANDYFSVHNNVPKPDFNRKQFGGSLGGPIAKDKVFGFFAFEKLSEKAFAIIDQNTLKELQLLKDNNIKIYGAAPGPASQLPTPFNDKLWTGRLDWTFNAKNSAYVSWNGNRDRTENDQSPTDLTSTNFNRNRQELVSLVWNSIISPTLLNQFTTGYQYWNNLIDAIDYSPVTVSFANVSFGTNGNVPQQSFQKKWQFKDGIDWRRGNHGLKFGADWIFEPVLGGFFKFTAVPGITFFDNPSVILSDKTKYPQGFNTPGIIQGISATNGDPTYTLPGHHHQFGWYVQDDWKPSRKLTLNLGLRYDVDVNLVGGSTQNLNRTYLILKKIDNPLTNPFVNGLPKDDKNNFSPRVGWAYDLTGGGTTVIRGGYGIYYDQVFLNIPLFGIQQSNPTIFGTVISLANSSIGVGDMPTRSLSDPLPPIPGGLTDIPNGSTGRIIDPNYVSPMSQQSNVGFSHQLGQDFVVEADFTHVLNTHESRRVRLNPRRGTAPTGTLPRVLEASFAAAGLATNRLADIVGESSVNRSRYDGLNIQLRKRLTHGVTFQTSYILSKAQGWGGRSGEFGATAVFDQLNIFDPREWAPTGRDERHRFVWSGVIDLPGGIQASPILQMASARPYTLTSGADTNRDGITSDLCIPGTAAPTTGRLCPSNPGINTQRGGFDLDGNPVSGRFFLMDFRVSKYFNLRPSHEGLKLGLFFESFNLTNRMNFGNRFSGNNRSAQFETTTGLPTGTYGINIAAPYQAQLGFRLQF